MIIGIVMERGLIRHFYKRPHADQILGNIWLGHCSWQEIVKAVYGANPISQPAPDPISGSIDIGVMFGFGTKCNSLSQFGGWSISGFAAINNGRGFLFPPVYDLRHGGKSRHGRS